MSYFWKRFKRYASTWIWLLKQNFNLQPVSLILSIVCGVGARLGTVIGFIASIKIAVWLFQPDSMPEYLSNIADFNSIYSKAMLILIPGLIFLATAILQSYYSLLALKIKVYVSKELSIKYAKSILSLSDVNIFKDRSTIANITKELRKTHSQLFAVETMVINLLVLVPVLILSLIAGAWINIYIVGILLILGIVLCVTYVFQRHKDINSIELKQLEIQSSIIEATNSILGIPLKKNDNASNNVEFLMGYENLTERVSMNQKLDHSFKSQSAFIMDLGQAIAVLVFLILLVNLGINSNLEYLVILALLFRFIIAYGKSILTTILKLSPTYKLILNLNRSI